MPVDDDVELEIEVSDARASTASERDPARAEAAQPTAETPGAATSARAAGRLWQGTRLRRALAIGGVIALAVAILLGTLPNAGVVLREALGLPAPRATAPLSIGAGTFLLENMVPWGMLLADGRPVEHLFLPRASAPQALGAPTFMLDRGRHTIEYRAAPFYTLRCVVSVPAGPSDTCPLAAPSPHDPAHPTGAARLLDMGARPERLPLDQQTALRQTIEAAMNADTPAVILAPGERYLLPDGAQRTASAPLHAELVYRVNQDLSLRLPADTGPCVGLCASYGTTFADRPPPAGSWAVAVHLVLTWRYTLADGMIAVSDGAAGSSPRHTHAMYTLGVQWEGHWVVSDLRSALSMVCDVASNALNALADAQVGKDDFGYTWHPYQAQPVSEGCLVAGAQRTIAFQPAGPTAFVLYRFGLLLAANALARQLFPTLPQATADERALARRLAPPQAQG